ncbi:MAG: thiol:disulfide interchange protein DsbA/DsbL [Methylophilales bacterium]|nr:thiol:disulfide interchange protein DsbA/DsbL [Methylophilales bacterium]
MKSLFAAMLMAISLGASAADPQPQLGIEFIQTPQPIPTDNPAKIEVTELFWYGCPHCYHFEEPLEAWVKKLPKDVEFKRVPGVARPSWIPMAKAYYTLEALNLTDKLHSPLFDAIHKQKSLRPDADEPSVIDWITKQSGLDKKKVEDTYRSFSVTTKVSRAMQLFQSSGASGVPSLMINGRFLTSSTMADGNDNALKVTNYLVDQVRKEKAGK